jgi:hypothetical protein
MSVPCSNAAMSAIFFNTLFLFRDLTQPCPLFPLAYLQRKYPCAYKRLTVVVTENELYTPANYCHQTAFRVVSPQPIL